MIDTSPVFDAPAAKFRWKRRLSFLIGILLVGTAVRAQEGTDGRFLPLPDGVPATVFDGHSEPEDPTEIAHEIRGSISDPSLASAPTDPSLEKGSVLSAVPSEPPASGAGEALPEQQEGATPPATESPTTAAISVIVENVETSDGTVNIGLCDKGLSRETCPYDKSGSGLGRIRGDDIRKHPAGQLRGRRLS